MASEFVQIRGIIGDLEGAIARVTRKVSLDVTANLVETTPVDTGWARANWIPSVGQPSESPVGSKESISVVEQALGKTKVAGFKDISQKVFITNNVPYITDLNDGTSKQAPAGFVQNAITKAVVRDLQGFQP